MRLVEASQEGRLTERAQAEKFEGVHREMMQGVNAMLDAITAPLILTGECVGRISKGEIPAKITNAYNGDFNTLKNNLNACIDGLGGLLEANSVLQKMATNDYTGHVEGKYEGLFATMAAAVNVVRERILHLTDTVKNVSQGSLKDLPAYKTIGRRSEHDELIPALILMMESLGALVADTSLLTKAALEGKLDARADAAKHKGEYRSAVEGVNAMLDAILLPIGEGNRILAQISSGKIDELIAQTYKGDHEKMKQAVNNVGIVLQSLQKELVRLTDASKEGQLSERGKPNSSRAPTPTSCAA